MFKKNISLSNFFLKYLKLMKKECWICKDLTIKTNLCDCDNDFSYCHSDCLNKWVICSSNYKCKFCDVILKLKKK